MLPMGLCHPVSAQVWCIQICNNCVCRYVRIVYTYMSELWIHIWKNCVYIYESIVDTYMKAFTLVRDFPAEFKDQVDDIHLKPPKNWEIALETPRTPLFTYSKLNYSTSAGLNFFCVLDAYSYVRLPCKCDMTLLYVCDMSHMTLKWNSTTSAGLNLENHGKRGVRCVSSVISPFVGGLWKLRTQLMTFATHCNTLQHAAAHCNTLQHTATHCKTLQNTSTHLRTQLMTSATHYNTLQHTATHCNTLQHTAPHCNALYHTLTNWRTQLMTSPDSFEVTLCRSLSVKEPYN